MLFDFLGHIPFIVANGAALDLPGSFIARTRSKCKLDHLCVVSPENGG
jgi:hypothetical protein